jgi:N-acetyltransferase 10
MTHRYAVGDKLESWLHELLCLDAAEHIPRPPTHMPHPSQCELYYVNRDTLFSYHKVVPSLLAVVPSPLSPQPRASH